MAEERNLSKELTKLEEELNVEKKLREKLEKKLFALQSRFDILYSAVPDIIMEVDQNKIYIWANQAGLFFFGSDVIGKEASDYFIGEQETYQKVQPLFDGDDSLIYVESWQRRWDGAKRLLAWWCRVLKDKQSNVTGAISTARDITEIYYIQQVRKESDAYFHAIFDNSIDGILILDSDKVMIKINHKISEMTGYSEIELIGNSLALLFPENFHTISILIDSMFNKEKNFSSGISIIHRDKTICLIELSGFPIELNNKFFLVCFFHRLENHLEFNTLTNQERAP